MKRKPTMRHAEWTKNPILQSKLNMAFMQISTTKSYSSSLEKMRLLQMNFRSQFLIMFKVKVIHFCIEFRWLIDDVSDRMYHIPNIYNFSA